MSAVTTVFGWVYGIAVATWIVGMFAVAIVSRRSLRRRAGVTPLDLPGWQAIEGGLYVVLWPFSLGRLRRWHREVEGEPSP